jgi:hypothetical protein
MKRQTEFFDRAVADLTPTEIRRKLVALAGDVPSIDQSKLDTILDHLTYKTSPNGGVDVTDDLKWCGEYIVLLRVAFFVRSNCCLLCQLNWVGRMEFTSARQPSGMVTFKPMFPRLGLKRSGMDSFSTT